LFIVLDRKNMKEVGGLFFFCNFAKAPAKD